MTATHDYSETGLTALFEQLNRIETALETLVREKTIKDWYSTSEVATILGKSDYTVREWCRLSRVSAIKKAHARGSHPEWLISHQELQRLRNEGLLANPATRS